MYDVRAYVKLIEYQTSYIVHQASYIVNTEGVGFILI
jgi:hypothetical protein